jgi:Flp pilus assembly protein TadG
MNWAALARLRLAFAALGRADGQSAVEVVAMLPIVFIVAAAAFEALAAGAAHDLAGHAAEAGAVAIAEGANPRDAARDAVPGWSRHGLDVAVAGSRVSVEMRPPLPVPVLSGLLETHATADAGPRPGGS